MASIYRVNRKPEGGRRRYSYLVKYRGPDRAQRTRSFRREADAKAFSAAVETDKRRGLWTDPLRGKVSVSEWASQWLESKVDLRPSSRLRLEGVVRTHIVPAWGHRKLDSISNAEVRAWVADLNRRRSAATTKKAYNALHQMFRAAVSDRRIPFDPCQDVPLPPEHCAEQRFLTVEQANTLADAIEPRFRALVLLAAFGGLRYGELAALRRGRVDVLRGRVTVAESMVDIAGYPLSFSEPKTKRSRRTVPLPRRVVRELEAHLAHYAGPQAGALVFTGPTGAPLRRAGFGRLWWEPATKAAGLDPFRFHALRHTFVALSIAAGCDARKVSIRAGHSSVAFTLDRYGHLFEDDEQGDMDRLGALIDSVPRPLEASVSGLRSS